ncbi:MAG: AMP-binding protein, partial [Acidobacteria bacterium]|nr:AMP-binding protein [Acidobacteriota bacterium]
MSGGAAGLAAAPSRAAAAGLEDIYPLSALQQGILFQCLYHPEEVAYVGQMTCLLKGELQPELLAQAWQQTVDRHPALRTAFAWERLEQPVQAVRRRVTAAMERRDWRPAPAGGNAPRLAAELAGERRRGFDLARPPLVRPLLVRLEEKLHCLIWTAHHLVVDGWSVALLLGDLLEHYGAACAGRQPILPEARPFRDFIAWQRLHLDRQAGAAESFWRAYLRGYARPAPLPGGRRERRSGARGDHQERLEARLPAAATAALQTFARRRRLTLNTVAQGAWALVLGRWSGEAEVVFGSVVAGRPAELAGAEAIVGLLINTLPVRCALPAGAGAAAWLAQLQAGQAAQQPFEQTPLPRLQALSELPPGAPLFETLYSFQSFASAAAARRAAGGVEVGALHALQRTHYPLTLTVTPPRPAEVGFQLSYDRRRLDPATAGRLLSQLAGLLAALPELSGRGLAELPLLTAAERHQLLYEWSGEQCAGRTGEGAGGKWAEGAEWAEGADGACLDELFAAWAARAPRRPALTGDGASLTYGELHQSASALAARLAALGAGPEQLVAVCLPRSPELVVALLAVLATGAAYVPLDPHYPP